MRQLIFTIILFIVSSNAVQSKTLTVDHSSITSTLFLSSSGDTIIIHSGIYNENLILDKKTILIGLNNPVIKGIGKGSVITIKADSCIIKGLTIEHSGSSLVDEDAGILLKSNRNTIEENTLKDILFGIYLYASNYNILRKNYVSGRPELGIGERGSGIHIWNSHSTTIVQNNITQTRDGMYIQNGNNNIIKDNYVTNLRYGLHYMYSDSNVFENNTFTNNLVGAAIMYSDNIIFKNNSFTHNRGFSSYGLLFQDCSGCLAENNYIIDNSIGMFLETANKNIFRNNIIACNDVSLQLFSSSDENIFYDNNFIDNLTQLTLVGKRTTTKWSHNNRGNYWSDYDGYDMDLDGIGDIPYKIYNVFELLEGNYPYVRLYLYSPASQSIEMAEKTFPVIQFSNEEDKYPLMMPAKVDMIHLNQSSIINRQVSISFGLGGILMVVFSIYVVYKKQLKNGKHCSTTF